MNQLKTKSAIKNKYLNVAFITFTNKIQSELIKNL